MVQIDQQMVESVGQQMKEQSQHLCRRISSNSCRYSTLQDRRYESFLSLPQCGLWTRTSFQRVQDGKTATEQWKPVTNTTSATGSTLTPLIVYSLDVIRIRIEFFLYCLPLSQPWSNLRAEKNLSSLNSESTQCIKIAKVLLALYY